MTPHFNSPSFSASGGQEYMDANVHTASPARLRLMLIERGVEVAAQIADAWRASKTPGSQESPGASEYSLKLLEILNELLSGVTGDQDEVCRKVADLYVFLVQHLIAAEEIGNADAIDEIRLVLETEAETWRLVCVNEVPGIRPEIATPSGAATSGGLNLQA